MITVENDKVHVETGMLSAVIERGWLTSLRGRAGGQELIDPFDVGAAAALELVYRGGEVVGLDDGPHFGQVRARRLSDTRAEIRFAAWDGDGVIEVWEDAGTGDLVIQPGGFSSRPGVRACRWNLAGIRADLKLVAPVFQGIRMSLDDPMLHNLRLPWPAQWEAALAIFQGEAGGFWVHARDTACRYKALMMPRDGRAATVGFDIEANGPIDANLAAGGLAWRINVHQGDWRTPAEQYRKWLWDACDLSPAEASRPRWIGELAMAVSWCPTSVEVLEALAQKADPARVLLHLPHWRTDKYDRNYPTYKPTGEARAFVARAAELGFHVAPHFNALEIDPSHPLFACFRDFAYRDIETRRLLGWAHGQQAGKWVPDANAALASTQNWNVMTKIHPGLSLWRSVLCEAIQQAAEELSLEAVFADVTLNTFNLHNCIVEGRTATEGLKVLLDQIGRLGGGLAVGGEGLNEIIAQGQRFAQAHLFFGYQSNPEGFERTGGCDLNQALFGRLCRTIGYSNLGGQTEDSRLRMRLHEEHGAIPTITIRSAEDITNPNPAVRRVLDNA